MTSELGRRIWFTIGALLVYRFGTYVPLPGIDPAAWAEIFRAQRGGILGTFDLFSGGSAHRMAIFALGLTPYLSAAITLQIVSTAWRALRALPKQGERGRKRLNDYTIGLTLILAALQSLGIASGLEDVANIVTNPGLLFRLTTVLTLTGGTMFLVWLSDQITTRGIGNGLSLIFFLGIVLELPGAIAGTLELGRQGALSSGLILVVFVLAVVLTGLIVFMELAERRLQIMYPTRQVGIRMVEGQSLLRVKLNGAGAIPVIVVSWLVFASQFNWRPLFLVIYALAIILCVFIYVAFVLDPEEIAENLKKHGGVIPGIEPGEATADYVDHAISRTTMLGAAYLALVCLVPEFLVAYAQVPFYLGGTSLLLVVCATLDLNAQLQGGALVRLGGQRP